MSNKSEKTVKLFWNRIDSVLNWFLENSHIVQLLLATDLQGPYHDLGVV